MEAPGNCPVCERIDSVQRITAIYNESFSTTTRMQPQTTYGANGKVHTTMRPVSVTQQTTLGRLLSPPKPQKIPLPQGERTVLFLSAMLSVILFLYGQSGLFDQIYDRMGNNGVWVFLGALVAIPIILWLLARHVFFRGASQERRQRIEQEYERNQRHYQQWERLCYCRRCNAVYISGSIRAVPPEEIDQLYYD